MSIEQLIIEDEINMKHDEFKEVFDGLCRGYKVKKNPKKKFNEFYHIFKKKSDNLRICVMNKESKKLGYYSTKENTIFMYLPELDSKDRISLVRSYYLYLLSLNYLKPSEEEIDSYIEYLKKEENATVFYYDKSMYGLSVIKHFHKKNSNCVNTVEFSLREERNSVIKKFLSKEMLCLDCYSRFPEKIREELINGIS